MNTGTLPWTPHDKWLFFYHLSVHQIFAPLYTLPNSASLILLLFSFFFFLVHSSSSPHFLSYSSSSSVSFNHLPSLHFLFPSFKTFSFHFHSHVTTIAFF
jgi:hypothetical protein